MDKKTLHGLLARTVAAHPSSAAITDETGTLDWTAFSARVDGLSGQLAENGVGRGDRVGLFLPDSADYLALIFACARIGALAVHINTRFRQEELCHVLSQSQPRALVIDWDFPLVDVPQLLMQLADETLATITVIIGRSASPIRIRGIPVVALAGRNAAAVAGQLDNLAIAFTTSGTTGGPKLAVHTQHGLAVHARDAARAFALDHTSTSIQILPFCGAAGHGLAMASVAVGAHIVCPGRFDPAIADRLIRQHGVTHAIGTDNILEQLVKAAEGRPYTSMKAFIFAPFGPHPMQVFEMAAAIGLAPHWTYGSSETQAFLLAHTPRCETPFSGEPVGRDAVIELRDPATDAVIERGAGVMQVKGTSVFAGYLNDPAASARVLTADGYFKTGDLMNRDPVGLAFQTRVSETMRLGGFLVNPEEIESIVKACDGVHAAVVVAVDVGQRPTPVAFVTLHNGAAFSEQQCIATCRSRIAPYKVPARVIVLDKLPLVEGPNGPKVHRPTLRLMAAAQLAS